MNPYVYIVIRKDLRPENYAPQIAHAALEAGYTAGQVGMKPTRKTHIVVLQVEDKIELEMVEITLHMEGHAYETFYENFANMGMTALATLPFSEKPTNSCLCSLELFNY